MSAIDVIARALLLVVLAAGVTVVLRRTAASLRALVWTAALGGALALPLLLPLTPAWRIEIVRPDAASPMPARTPQAALPVADLPVHKGQPGPGRPTSEASFASTPISPALPALNPEEPVSTTDWSVAAVVGSLAVTLLLAARLAVGHARLRRLARTANVVDDPGWQSAVDEVRRHLALRGRVDVRASEGISIPAVAGVFRPTLLLPADARAWGADVRRAVLLHELAHVARRDALAQLVSQGACALYWFLPPVWLGARRAAALRERASDDVVLLAGVTPAGYAESLVRLARSASGADVPAAALAMARRSRLRERVIAILDPAVPRTAGSLVCALVVTAMAGLAAGVAAVEPAFVAAAAPDARDGVVVERAALPRLSVPPAPVAPPSSSRPGPRMAAASAAQAAPQQTSVICNDKVESSSTSINDDDNRRKWKVELTGNGCKLVLQAEGRIDFSPDFSDISAISSGGFLRIDATNGGTRRQLDITPGNGGLRRSWRVDGREAAYDEAARAWFAAFLVELDRRTAIGVDVRLPHLLRQGGVDAVLDETALLPPSQALPLGTRANSMPRLLV
jgi:beta-lactamase regulating signal transducer with metallopeptidase domain